MKYLRLLCHLENVKDYRNITQFSFYSSQCIHAYMWSTMKDLKLFFTYWKAGWTVVGVKELFGGSSRSELIAGCDLPKPHGWVRTYPPVNSDILGLAWVFVLVIHLHNKKKRKRNMIYALAQWKFSNTWFLENKLLYKKKKIKKDKDKSLHCQHSKY